MPLGSQFAAIIQNNVSLASHTLLRIGGPADYLITPRSREELAQVLSSCYQEKIPARVLGSGTNLLVRDEGIHGAVVKLSEPCFTKIVVQGKQLKSGGGASLTQVISEATRHGLTGFESLLGINATIGGALRHNAGDREGEIAEHVRRIQVMDAMGTIKVKERSEVHFGEHSCDLEDPVVLEVDFELIPDQPEAIIKRLRRAWISRKVSQPLHHQAAARMFKNPRGFSAAALIERAGMAKTRVGSAEISERNGNYVVAHPGTTARDILELLERTRTTVHEKCGIMLEREIDVW